MTVCGAFVVVSVGALIGLGEGISVTVGGAGNEIEGLVDGASNGLEEGAPLGTSTQ